MNTTKDEEQGAVAGQVDCHVRRAVVAALVLACAGCSVGERTDAETPKGWRTFVAGGNHFTHVVPVTMEDGTRCVVTFGNGAGRGVSCDWSRAN